MDSTTLKAWSNGGKTNKADQQAGWSVKQGTQGVKEYTYGWKLHLLVDCEYELPISAHISPGNVHDSRRASNLLSQARFTYSKFHPRYILADKGYSGRPLSKLIHRQYRAMPIIQVNKAHTKLKKEMDATEQSVTWKAIYAQRQAVERAFSRLKGQLSLNSIRVRGRTKVSLHCYMVLIAYQSRNAVSSRATETWQSGFLPRTRPLPRSLGA